MQLPINHTVSLIIITCIISLIAFNSAQLKSRLIFWPPALQRGQYDRFITHGFIHADGSHLLFNMITLFFFGSAVEHFYRDYMFDMGFVLFYLGGLIAAIFPSYLKNKNNAHWASLGASGAVSAVLFSFILFQPWNILLIFFIPVPAIIFAFLYVGYSIWAGKRNSDNINHSAHLWGAAYGVIVTLLLRPDMFTHFLTKLLNPPFL